MLGRVAGEKCLSGHTGRRGQAQAGRVVMEWSGFWKHEGGKQIAMKCSFLGARRSGCDRVGAA